MSKNFTSAWLTDSELSPTEQGQPASDQMKKFDDAKSVGLNSLFTAIAAHFEPPRALERSSRESEISFFLLRCISCQHDSK